MKKFPLFLTTLYLLLSCSGKETLQQKSVQNSVSTSKEGEVSAKQPKKDMLGYDHNYSFTNDSICNEVSIELIDKRKEDNIPEKLRFGLTLSNKQKDDRQINFEGIAVLTSANESFSDNTEIDAGEYFAADYVFSDATHNIKIRLDVERYEACVISIDNKGSKDPNQDYSSFVKKYPDYDVMKKGRCE